MKNHSRPVLLLLVIIIQTACVRMKAAGNGNTQTLPYRYVNTLKTSSSDESRCLYFDHNGLMWIGTSSGLKLFDGYNIHTFKSTVSSPGLLPHNTVLSITEDHKGMMWVGTRNGLVRIDPHTWKTKRYPVLNNKSWVIYTLFTSRDGTVWMGNDAGLSRYVPENDTFCNYSGAKTWVTDIDGKKRVLGSYSVKSIVDDAKGNIYIGTWDCGLLRLNRKTGNIVRYPKINNQNSAYSLFFDSRNRLWVGTWGYGLIRLDNPDNINNPSEHVYCKDGFETFYKVIEDPTTGTIWASTREGINVMSRDGNLRDISFYSNSGDQTIQQLKFCNDMATDGHGNTWIETLNNGIVHVNTAKSSFNIWDMRSAGYALPVTSVCTIYSPDGQNVWLTMKPYGITLYNTVTGKALFSRQIPGFNKLPEDFMCTSITGVTQRYNGELWFANNGFGIASYCKGKPVKLYTTANTRFVKDNSVNSLMQSKTKVMWIGQRIMVSVAYPDDNGYMLKMTEGDDDFTECDARNFMEDSKGDVWISTDNEGIIRVRGNVYKPNTLKFHHYCPRRNNFVVNDATACFEDSHHRLWAISNSGGLFRYDVNTDKFVSVNELYGIHGDRIFTINEDKVGNLWMTTDYSLICLPYGTTSSVTSFGMDDGLTDILFYPNASFQFGNELYLVKQDGFCHFNPNNLLTRKNEIRHKLIVTDLFIDDKSFSMLDSAFRKKISAFYPMYSRKITIPASVGKFSVEFAYLSYTSQDKIKYAYKLEGYDDDWKHLNVCQHRATFENLHSGTYHLRIRAYDTYGSPHELPYTITVHILPPWYASWWACLIYLLFMIGMIYAGVIWYKNYLKTKNRLQMAVVLSNITHELLTPLTVISASVDDLRINEPKYCENYNLIQNNISRLTRLLRQILEVRKTQAGQLKLLVSQGDLSVFVTSLCENIRPITGMKDNKLVMNIQEDIHAWYDSDKVDKIVYNLLSNAFKYNKTGGTVTVTLACDGDYATLSVADEGIGMCKEKMKHLYARFLDGDYRKMNTSGTGIGLSLTHDLVVLHHGMINCESKADVGTTFTVSLPILQKYYREDEIDVSCSRVEKEKILISELYSGDESVDLPSTDESYVILLVEDNDELLEIMKRLLSHKYRVLTAKNGQQAFNVIQKEDLDIVISDVMMPVMDGIELTQAIKNNKDYAQLPVILLTAKTQEADRNIGYETGADEYIAKPFKIQDLLLRIDNIIANRERIRQKFSRQTDFNIEGQCYSNPDGLFVQKAIECVKMHIDDSEYGRDAFASDMCVSSSTLYNRLRALTGQNIIGFIMSIRLKEACCIARSNPYVSISDLSMDVGFNTPKYFSRCFKKEFGMSLKEYLESIQPMS